MKSGRRQLDSTRRRHIRDIAHLYLSQRKGAAPAGVNLWVTGAGKDGFPGLHVANLAAAFATRDFPVSVLEMSGLLPNASFYFCHPPRVYLCAEAGIEGEGEVRGAVPGLEGVCFIFDPKRAPLTVSSTGQTRVNLIHLPPGLTARRLAGHLKDMTGLGSGEWWGLYLASGSDEDPSLASLAGAIGGDAIFALGLDLAPATDGNDEKVDGGYQDLGHICRWEHTVADRVPIVFRDPAAELSRAYLTVCDRILARMEDTRRTRAGIPHARMDAGRSTRR